MLIKSLLNFKDIALQFRTDRNVLFFTIEVALNRKVKFQKWQIILVKSCLKMSAHIKTIAFQMYEIDGELRNLQSISDSLKLRIFIRYDFEGTYAVF